MSNKEKYAKSATGLIISGVLGIVFGFVLEAILGEVELESFFAGKYSAWEDLNALTYICIFISIIEIIAGIVYAIMAACEPVSNSGSSNYDYRNPNSDFWRPKNEKVRIAPEGKWKCRMCGTINDNRRATCDCGARQPVTTAISNGSKSSNASASPAFWQCTKCGKINENCVGTCGCGERKPGLTASSNASANLNFWHCPKCGSENLNRNDCWSCGYDNSKEADGNFWQCTKCGNINANCVGTCGCGEQNPKRSSTKIVGGSDNIQSKCVVRFCRYCGNSIASNQKFCDECGAKLQ